MYNWLKLVKQLPLNPIDVEKFLYRAGQDAVFGLISIDNWKYLAHLIAYKIEKNNFQK